LVTLLVGVATGAVDGLQSGAAAATGPPSSQQGPPTGTLKPLVAPPRSAKPVFTGEAARVERAFRARVSAFDHQDVAGALALTSKAPPSSATADDLRSFMENYRVRLFRINAIAVDGNTATIDYENAIVGRNLRSTVNTLLAQHEVWTREDGGWKNVTDVSSAPGIPSDLATVDVTLRDGAATSVGPLPSRSFAFKIANDGAAAKGVFILGIPRDQDLATLIPVMQQIGDARSSGGAAQFPDGVQELGATPDVPANGDGTMVFNRRLPKGRYLLVSVADGDVDPLIENEYADFTVT
jgi:hypothetical protein